MAERITGQSGVPAFEPIMKSIAGWVRLCRIALDARNELAVASPEEVAQIARELGVPTVRLAEAMTGWPPQAELLRRMLIALGIDPDAAGLNDDGLIDELQRACGGCRQKEECERDLAGGKAAENFYGYCPNARTLDSIHIETTLNRF